MLRSVIGGRLNSIERQLGVSIDYVRFILKTSLRLFFKFAKIFSFAQCRKRLPADAFHVASIVAARHEDCGTCLQIAVNMATQEKTPLDVVQAVLDRRADDLPEDLAEVYHFTEAVVCHSGAEEPLRETIRQRWGDEALIELAMGIAASRVFPTVKRALGYAVSCSRVQVAVPEAVHQRAGTTPSQSH